MDALTRREYPSMLDSLPPAVAVAKLNDRVKKITKVNLEIADWLQERRKIEEAYATSLRKLSKRQLNDVWGHMGVFDTPWKQMMIATEDIAKSHNYFAKCIEKDVELPLRNFAATNNEMANVTTMRANISSLARELEDAQSKKERFLRKSGKVSASRVDAASNRFKTAKQQWDVQAAFIYESLQALDERRVNHLRDILTQYQTHEVDHIQLNREAVENTLKYFLEISTEAEIRNFSHINRAKNATLNKNVQLAADAFTSEPNASSGHDDNQSDRSVPSRAEPGEIKKLQRMGTLLTRRRKSVQSVFRSASPSLKKNGFQPFGRDATSRSNGLQSPSRVSTSHAAESDTRLFPLPESPFMHSPKKETNENKLDKNLTVDLPPRKSSLSPANGAICSNATVFVDSESSSGLSPNLNSKKSLDNEGFSVPHVINDPISRAMEEISQDNQPQFKLSIRKDPILEQESDAEAALSNVTNTLRSLQTSPPSRKTGTFRGRRDLRNTISIHTGDGLSPTPEYTLPTTSTPASPAVMTSEKVLTLSRIPSIEKVGLAPLDNVSIRSGRSWKTQALTRHPEMHLPGLNCSIIETTSISFEGENTASITINGEIAFINNLPSDIEHSTAPGHDIIKIYNLSNLEMLIPNRSFIQPVSTQCQDQFIVNLPLISNKAFTGFTYSMHSPEISKTPIPLLIKFAWKCQANKLGLVIEYSLNPVFSSTPVSFSNMILIAHYKNVSASSCQTKPSGIHLKDKLLVYWRLGDVTLDAAWLKAIARFSGTENAIPEPDFVEAKWELNATEKSLPFSNSQTDGGEVKVKRLLKSGGISSETLSKKEIDTDNTDPFADEPIEAKTSTIKTAINGTENLNWQEISVTKKLVTGLYVSK